MLSGNTAFFPPTQWSIASFYGQHDPYSTAVGDVNGDGRADAIAFDGTSTLVMLAQIVGAN